MAWAASANVAAGGIENTFPLMMSPSLAIAPPPVSSAAPAGVAVGLPVRARRLGELLVQLPPEGTSPRGDVRPVPPEHLERSLVELLQGRLPGERRGHRIESLHGLQGLLGIV